MKKITLWLFALFTCWQMTAQVNVVENFNSSTNLPTGWTSIGFGYVTGTESCSVNSYIDNLYSTSATGEIVSPNQVAGSNGTNLTVSFDYKIEDWNSTAATASGWGNIQVQYSINNGVAWTTFFTINDTNHVVANTCATFSNVIPAASLPSGSDIKIRFLFTWVSGDYDIYLDNFSATQVTALPPSCTVLSTPVSGATNISSSTVSWNVAPGIPSGYKLSVGTTSGGTNVLNMFDVGNVTSYNLGALSAGTTHYVKVFPYNANGQATGCTESSFTTCGAITTYPSVEPFDVFLPNACWMKGDNGDITAGPATFGSNNFYEDGFANVGSTGSFAYNIWQANANDWIISPQFTIPATGYELKFDAAAANYGAITAVTDWESDDSVEVLVSSTGTTNWTVLSTFNASNVPSNTGSVNIIDLDAYSGQTVRFAYRVVEGTTNGTADFEFSVDNFQIRLTPSCIEPLGLVSASITSTGASISWDPTSPVPSAGYEYFVSTTNTLPPAAGTATTNTFAVLSGLTPATTYYIFVRANCGSGAFSPWSTSINFTTACASVTSFVQNFDAVTSPGFPICWGKLGTGGSAYLDNFNANSTPNVLYMASWSITDLAVVKMQPVSNLGAGTHRLKLKIRASSSWSIGGIVEFGYLTNPMDATTFVAFTTMTAATLTYENMTFAPPVGTYSDYPAFRHTGNPTNSLLIDDVVWEPIPSCAEPTALVYANITSTGVDVSWTAPTTAPASGYEYVISTSATAPTTAGTAVTNIYVSLSGLTPQTTYYIFVRAICSISDASPWVGPVSFLTACVPVTALPWTEGFESVTTPAFPPCWFEENGDYTTSDATFDNTAHSGTKYLRDAWSATNEFMWSPGFQLTAGTSYDFSSWIQGDGGNGWVVDYFVNSSQISTGATQLGATYNVPGTGTLAIQPYTKITRSFVPTTSGVYYFAFRVNQPNFAPNYVAFDDVELKVTPNVIPACATGLQATPNTTCGNFANQLSWAPVTDSTGYYVTIGTTSGGTDIANAVSVSANNYSFLGTINTQYFWKVVPFSGAGAATGCAIQSFTTVATGCYCPSVPTSNDGSGITNATVGTSPFVIADVMYVNNTTTAVAVEPGTNTNVQLVFATGYDYDINIWIDFNNDFDFNDAGELVKTGIACTNVNPNTVDASFLMPLTAPTGAHRMRIGTADLGQVPPAPCYSGSYGVTLDFKVDTTLGSNSFDTSNFVAYPNPVKDVLNLSYKTAISNVKVINLLGQEVVNAKATTNDVQVNMSALNAGVYIVNVTVDDIVHSIKVIKE